MSRLTGTGETNADRVEREEKEEEEEAAAENTVEQLEDTINAANAEEKFLQQRYNDTAGDRNEALTTLAENMPDADALEGIFDTLGVEADTWTDGEYAGTGLSADSLIPEVNDSDGLTVGQVGDNAFAMRTALLELQKIYAAKCDPPGAGHAEACSQLGSAISELEAGDPANASNLAMQGAMLYMDIKRADADAAEASVDVAVATGSTTADAAAAAAAAKRAEAEAAFSAQATTANFLGISPPPSYAEQCFLLTQLYHFVKYKREVLEGEQNEKRLPYQDTTSDMPPESSAEDKAWGNALNFNASLQCSGDPFAYMNMLTQYPGYGNLLNMKTQEIANLQPMIRLYKIIDDKNGNESQLEIPFNSYLTTDDLSLLGKVTEGAGARGAGVGIQDFTFSYEADNPFAVKKSIKAKLTMFANSFGELMRSRHVDGQEFKYIDLALKTGRSKSLSMDTLNPKSQSQTSLESSSKLNFRLKAVVGWAFRPGWGDSTDSNYELNTISPEVKTALYNSFVTLNLTPTIHDFDIDDQGRVKFSIAFLAYVEDFFDQPNFNIFPPTGDDGTNFEKDRVIREVKAGVWAAKCDSENLRKLREQQQEEIEGYKVKSFQALMGQMFTQNKIRYMNISGEEVVKWRASPITYDAVNAGLFAQAGADGEDATAGITSSGVTTDAQVSTEIENALSGHDEEKANNIKLAFTATGAITNQQTLTFFYVSDLMDIILEGISKKYGDEEESFISQLSDPEIYKDIGAEGSDAVAKELIEAEQRRAKALKEQFRKFRLLLGPLEVVKQDSWESDFPSLGDLPVAVSYFIEWVSKKMSDRDEVYYPLPKFLNDFFNDLVREYLNSSTCFGNQAKQRTTVSQAAVTSYRDYEGGMTEHPDEITESILWWRKSGGRPTYARVNTHNWVDGTTGVSTGPMLRISADRDNPIVDGGVNKEINWLTYYAGRSQPVERMKGDEETDHAVGIFHYGIGRDRGITKTIKLKKTDSTGLKEVRFEQEGYDGLAQLREVFDVDISTYANVNAFPGCYIYVDPLGFDPGADKDVMTMIGIGGYHMIIRSEHSFGPGRADSRIHAKWVASTDARVTRNFNQVDSDTSRPDDPQYCFQADEPANERAEASDNQSWTSKITEWFAGS
tara:strand:+ start:2131 stop:5529 length:3399 start_codon:yes stop_codon:yes gene_type:complete